MQLSEIFENVSYNPPVLSVYSSAGTLQTTIVIVPAHFTYSVPNLLDAHLLIIKRKANQIPACSDVIIRPGRCQVLLYKSPETAKEFTCTVVQLVKA